MLFYNCHFEKGSQIAFPLSLSFANKYFSNHQFKYYKLSEVQIFSVSCVSATLNLHNCPFKFKHLNTETNEITTKYGGPSKQIHFQSQR